MVITCSRLNNFALGLMSCYRIGGVIWNLFKTYSVYKFNGFVITDIISFFLMWRYKYEYANDEQTESVKFFLLQTTILVINWIEKLLLSAFLLA